MFMPYISELDSNRISLDTAIALSEELIMNHQLHTLKLGKIYLYYIMHIFRIQCFRYPGFTFN